METRSVDPSVKLTFKPISRGFRCNQTDVKVKNCFNHERLITNKGKKLHRRIPKSARSLPQVELSEGMWKCPYPHTIASYRMNRGYIEGVIDSCRACGGKVYIKHKNN
jgi:hypothetical protein